MFSCPEIVWSWFILLDLCVVNLSGVMPRVQHLFMEFANLPGFVSVLSLFLPLFTFHGAELWPTPRCKLWPKLFVAPPEWCHLFLVPSSRHWLCHCCTESLLLAESLSLGAKGKGNFSPPFSKRESGSDETPKGSCGLRAALEYQKGTTSPAWAGERSVQWQQGHKLCLVWWLFPRSILEPRKYHLFFSILQERESVWRQSTSSCNSHFSESKETADTY